MANPAMTTRPGRRTCTPRRLRSTRRAGASGGLPPGRVLEVVCIRPCKRGGGASRPLLFLRALSRDSVTNVGHSPRGVNRLWGESSGVSAAWLVTKTFESAVAAAFSPFARGLQGMSSFWPMTRSQAPRRRKGRAWRARPLRAEPCSAGLSLRDSFAPLSIERTTNVRAHLRHVLSPAGARYCRGAVSCSLFRQFLGSEGSFSKYAG